MNGFSKFHYPNFIIEVILQENERVILIKCKYLDINKYSSVFNLENLKNVDRIFSVYPPPSLSDAYNILRSYFKENYVSIKEVSNSKIIIEIEKDFKPNMIFELKREQNNYNNKNKYNNENLMIKNNNKYIENMNDNIKNQMFMEYKNYSNNNNSDIGNMLKNSYINYNKNMYNYNNNMYNYNNNMNYNGNMRDNIYMDYNINNSNHMNYNGNMNTNHKNYNEKMNNNNNVNYYGNMNENYNNNSYNNSYNNMNNIYNNNNGNNNEMIKTYINNDMSLELSKSFGGANNENTDDINSFIDNSSFLKNFINNTKNNNNNYLNEKQSQVIPSFNVRVAKPKDNNIDGPLKNLNCLLKFLLLKKISENNSDFGNFKDVEEILNLFKNEKDIQGNKISNEEKNILDYLKYIDKMDLDLQSFIDKIFEEKQEMKNEIISYWKYLSKYEEYNNDFEHKLFEDLKNCHLEFSIENINILERDNPEEYEQKKKECKNMKKMILYHISEINSDSNKLNMELKYSNKSFSYRGYYFSDSIDYIIICQNNEHIPEIGKSFSLMACEIFYDEEKLKEFDINLSSSNSSHIYISNELVEVEPDGLIKFKNYYLSDNNSKKIEYVLSEKYQILPLYTFTLRRNEYFVLYRDPNFIGEHNFSGYLKGIILKSLKYSKNKNFYFESSTEEALKLLLKKKKEKVILITSIRFDKSGKRFVEIARKILNFELIVLFYSISRIHFNWIKDFPNCLYTSLYKIYEGYISNYKESALKELKKKVENSYNIKLREFTFDFLCYSNCDDDLSISYYDYNSRCPYFKSVYIFNPNKSLYLSMTKEGKVNKSEEKCLWEVTLIDNDITFFSNGFYLDIDNKNKEIAIGSKEMKKWYFDALDNNCYYFINIEEGKNCYLTMEDDEDVRVNKKDPCKNSIFQLNDD